MTWSRREANRVAKARADAATEAALDKRGQEAGERRALIDRLALSIERLVPLALDTLAARKYEGIRDVVVPVMMLTRYQALGRKHVGGYPLAKFHVHQSGDHEILLLTDGRLFWGEPRTVEDYIKAVLDQEGFGKPVQRRGTTWEWGRRRHATYRGPFSLTGMGVIEARLRKIVDEPSPDAE